MNERIHYTLCPVCNSTVIKNVLEVKDHSVSSELFTIAECGSCSVRFTQDVPDQNSIGSYYKSEDYISHTNTASGVINKLYHLVRKITIAGKRKLIERNTGMKTGTLLDVGSGIGSFVNEMRQHGWEATGLEPDADARKVAEELYGLEMADTEQFYQLPAGHFDTITLWHVLEHVHYLQNYVQQLRNLLKDNGKLFIAVPNYTSADAGRYKENWAAYDVPRHLYHFSPRSMQILMERNGLRILQLKPMWYDSFYVSLLSSKYKNDRLQDGQGQTNWPAAIWNGLHSNINALADKKKCSSVIYVIGK